MSGSSDLAAMLPRRRLGRTGYDVSVVGIGGWLGLLDDPDASRAAKESAAIEAVQRAVDLGVTYFDTSPAYGEAERHLGLALKELAPMERARLQIATKAGTDPDRHHHYDADSIRWSVGRSRRLLFTDWIDILLIHDPRSDAEMEQVMGAGGAVDALEEMKEQGTIGAIGLGVRSHRFLRRAIESERFDMILTPYDYTLLRTSARPIIELAAARDVGIANGSPYAAGLIAGLNPDLARRRRAPLSPQDVERARALWSWCQERDLDLGALAMQFSLRNEQIAVTLVGPRTADEVAANVRHATSQMPPETWPALDAFLRTLVPPGLGGEAEA